MAVTLQAGTVAAELHGLLQQQGDGRVLVQWQLISCEIRMPAALSGVPLLQLHCLGIHAIHSCSLVTQRNRNHRSVHATLLFHPHKDNIRTLKQQGQFCPGCAFGTATATVWPSAEAQL
jgi:hypothetical protein